MVRRSRRLVVLPLITWRAATVHRSRDGHHGWGLRKGRLVPVMTAPYFHGWTYRGYLRW